MGVQKLKKLQGQFRGMGAFSMKEGECIPLPQGNQELQ